MENDYKEIHKLMKEKFDDDELERMQNMAYRIGIMTAVRNLGGSTNYDDISQELFNIKDGIIPLKAFREIVEKNYPELIKEQMIGMDGNLSQEGFMIVADYEHLLGER